MLFDLGLFSGMRLADSSQGRDTTWARRATYMKLVWQNLMRYATHIQQEAAEFSYTQVITLRPFGLDKVAGLCRSYKLFMGTNTEMLIAKSALRQNSMGLTPFHEAPDYGGLKCVPAYQVPEVAKLDMVLTNCLRGPRRRLRRNTKMGQ